MDLIWSFIWGAIPTWVWIVIAGVALGACWRTFGWQGVVGGLAAVVTLGAYRQGWRDRDTDKPPLVPVRVERLPPRKVKTVVDFIKEWRGQP